MNYIPPSGEGPGAERADPCGAVDGALPGTVRVSAFHLCPLTGDTFKTRVSRPSVDNGGNWGLRGLELGRPRPVKRTRSLDSGG